MEDEEDEEHKQYAIIFMCFALLTHTHARVHVFARTRIDENKR